MKSLHLLLCLLCFLVIPSFAQDTKPLTDTVLVIDPGHGDGANRFIAEDPGATAATPFGQACECVFTWDTSMRLKALAEKRGATVFLTTRDPNADYEPKDWSAQQFPEPGSQEFPFRTLVEREEPASEWRALQSRVETANRIYEDHSADKDVVFLSLHFDSTNPDLEGISFYYPTWCRPQPAVETLKTVIREHDRARRSLTTGEEVGLAKPYKYAVLTQSQNPDSYLVELGNMRSLDAKGENPDLVRMQSAEHREQYAELLVEALMKRPRSPRSGWPKNYLFLVAGMLVVGLGSLKRFVLRPNPLKL